MGFDSPDLEFQLQQARKMCESNADRMREVCQIVKANKSRVKVQNHDACAATCACKSVSSGKVTEQPPAEAPAGANNKA